MPTNTAAVQAREYQTHQVHYLRKYFTKADAGNTLSMGFKPPGAAVIRGGVVVIEAFNAGTNNRLDLGTVDDTDGFGTLLALGTVGVIAADEMATTNDAYSESAVEIKCVVDVTGTAATTGKGIAWVEYIIPDGLVGAA